MADHKEVAVVVDQFVRVGKALAHRHSALTNQLCHCRIELRDEAAQLISRGSRDSLLARFAGP